ncbi:MAG: ATP-binding protein [Phycisphaerales bacterium]
MADRPSPTPPQPQPPSGNSLRLSRGPCGERPDPADAPFALERMAALAHDLSSLLDGSMRCLGLAKRSLSVLPAHNGEAEAVRRYVETVQGALERMADLVSAAMRGTSAVVGSPTLSPKRMITLGEALGHAAEVLLPEAQERGIAFRLDLAPNVASLPAGPLYSVLLNGLRNAMESISRAQDGQAPAGRAPRSPAPAKQATRHSGTIEVIGRRRPLGSRRGAFDLVEVEMHDDGVGLRSVDEGNNAFALGVTSKAAGLGVGLALSREVLAEIGGTIELVPRDPALPAPRPGAVLRLCYPVAREPKRA